MSTNESKVNIKLETNDPVMSDIFSQIFKGVQQVMSELPPHPDTVKSNGNCSG